MKEIKMLYGDSCSRCHQMRPFIEKFCQEKQYLYSEENREDSVYKDDVTSLPTIIVKDEEKIDKLTMEEFISNKDSI